jgi:hypothetical protein
MCGGLDCHDMSNRFCRDVSGGVIPTFVRILAECSAFDITVELYYSYQSFHKYFSTYVHTMTSGIETLLNIDFGSYFSCAQDLPITRRLFYV